MSSFQYEAYHSAEQRRVNGTIEAGDLQEARRMLMKQDLVPIHLRVAGGKDAQDPDEHPGPRGLLGWLFHLTRSLDGNQTQELVAFTRSMATMLGAGLPVTAALQNQQRFARSARYRRIAVGMCEDVQNGMTFTQALSRYPEQFNPVYRRIVAVGEQSGELEAVLNRLAELLRRRDGVGKRIWEVLLYPIFTFGVWAFLGLLLTVVLIPMAVGNLQAAHFTISPSLQIAMAIRWYWLPAVLAVLAALIMIVRTMAAAPAGKAMLDEMLWSLPKVGSLIDLTACEHFVSTLRVALASGLLVTDAVDLAVESIGHTQSRNAYRAVLPVVQAGEPIIHGIIQVPYIPDVVVQILAAGEEAGTLDKVLTASEAFLRDEIVHSLEVALKMFQFLMMLVMFVGIACFLALFYGVLFGGIFGSVAEQVSRSITQPGQPPVAP